MKSKMKSSNTDMWVDVEGRFNLAGVQYSDYQLVCGSLKPGTVCDLVGEPSNPIDNRAIKVMFGGIHIGYVPRYSIFQSELWNAHQRGCKCIAVVTAFNKNNPTWQMITVQCRKKVNKKTVLNTTDISF